jgi:hypothetical protein
MEKNHMLRFSCPACSKSYSVTPEKAGMRTKCPDYGRNVSKRTTACHHCGCPGVTPSNYEAVFNAFVQAVRDAGYTLASLDKANGRIVFRTDVSLFSFGQEMSVVIIDNGDEAVERVRLGREQADHREPDEGVVVAESPGF